MATTPSTPDPRDIQRLEELYKKIQGYTEASARAAAQLAISNGKAAEELARLEAAYKDLMKDIEGSRTAFSNIVDSIKGMTNNIGKATTAFKGLEGLASKLQYHQEGINRLSTKELETLQKRAKERARDLEFTKKQTLEEIQQLTATRNRSVEESARLRKLRLSYAEISAQITESESSLKDFNDQIEHAVNNSQAIDKTLGNTGALLKGISKIPFLGNLPGMEGVLGKVEADVAKIQEKTGKTVSKTKAMGMAFKEMGPVIGKSLIDPMTGVTFLAKQIFDAFKAIDSGAGELAKNMNMSYNGALQLRGQLADIATDSGDAALSTKRLSDSYMAIGASLGANADINEADLKTFTKLREQAGYTNEELTSMYKMSLVTGKSIEDTTSEFLGGAKALSAQKGLAINVKQLMKETSNASNTIKLSLGGSSKALAEAAVAAKALGSDLGKVEAISGKLLNFEDSISAELEAELLTGKQINLETARLAALNNDMATVAEEIKNQIGGSAEFSKMNRIQQEAFANAVGMSREELANTLVEQEALQRVGVKNAEAAKAKYDLLRETMTAEQAAAALGDKELAKQYEQQSVAEKFQQAVEKIKDIFVSIVDGPFGAMLSGFSALLSNAGVLKGVLVGIGIILAGMAINAIMTASALTLGAAIVAVVAGAAVAFSAQDSATQRAQSQAGNVKAVSGLDDGMIDPNGGIVASLPKGGIIAQYDKDDYIVGTTNKPGSGGGASIDYDRLATAMAKVNVTPVVNLDGRKISDNTTTNTNISAVKQQ